MVSKWKNRDLLQVVQQGCGWWASLGYTQHHPPGVAEHSFHKSSGRLSQKKWWYADSFICLVAGIKTMQCTNAGLYQGADKTSRIRSRLQAKSWPKGGTYLRASTGRQKVLCSKNSHICTSLLVLCWMMSWGAVEAVSIQGTRPG